MTKIVVLVSEPVRGRSRATELPCFKYLYCHSHRLLNICAHIIDEQTPGPPQTKTSLPSLPNAPSLSPIKRKAKAIKDEGAAAQPNVSPADKSGAKSTKGKN